MIFKLISEGNIHYPQQQTLITYFLQYQKIINLIGTIGLQASNSRVKKRYMKENILSQPQKIRGDCSWITSCQAVFFYLTAIGIILLICLGISSQNITQIGRLFFSGIFLASDLLILLANFLYHFWYPFGQYGSQYFFKHWSEQQEKQCVQSDYNSQVRNYPLQMAQYQTKKYQYESKLDAAKRYGFDKPTKPSRPSAPSRDHMTPYWRKMGKGIGMALFSLFWCLILPVIITCKKVRNKQ